MKHKTNPHTFQKQYDRQTNFLIYVAFKKKEIEGQNILVGGIDLGSHQIEVKTLVMPCINYISMGISSKVLPSP